MQDFSGVIEMSGYREAMQAETVCGSFEVGARRMRFAPGEIKAPKLPYWGLILYRSPVRLTHEIGGKQSAVRDVMPGDFFIRPANTVVQTSYETEADITVFALEGAKIENYDGLGDRADFDGLSAIAGRPLRARLMSSLAERLDELSFAPSQSAASVFDPLYADTLLQAAVLEMERLAKGAQDAEAATGHLIPPQTLRAIDDFIDETDDARIDLADLARVAGLSAVKFARSFRETTEMTPYQYVLKRRIDRARTMIETTRHSLAEIAFRCGFASQSHMTDVFRNKLGMTPGHLRKN
ncbi:MAG: AraC family transcriptional regulator [Pseudomonadota bacterium]